MQHAATASSLHLATQMPESRKETRPELAGLALITAAQKMPASNTACCKSSLKPECGNEEVLVVSAPLQNVCAPPEAMVSSERYHCPPLALSVRASGVTVVLRERVLPDLRYHVLPYLSGCWIGGALAQAR